MRRKCTERFMQWKRDPRKKPLVLQGGRQTGKTWILRDFGEKNYDITIYINMETERSAADFLSVPREPEEILLFLESYANKPIRQEGTLLILDNFQCVAQGPSILGGLNLDFPGYHIAVIEKGGAPGLSRYDIGDVEIIHLFPMDFEEFLWANKEYSLAKEIHKHMEEMSPMGKSLHAKASAQFYLYLCIGGMPGAICEYRREKKLLLVPDIQTKILALFLADIFSKAPEGTGRHARNCFMSVPSQLCKENGKFQYKQVVKGGTAKLYQRPLQWLTDSGFIYPSPRKIMDTEETEEKACKYYFPDTGLAACTLGIPTFLLLNGKDSIQVKGIVETYLAQCFVQNGYSLSYWSSGNQAKLPFLLKKENSYAAVDFRLSTSEKLRNLSRYQDCGGSGRMYLLSPEDFQKKERYHIIPFYAAFCI